MQSQGIRDPSYLGDTGNIVYGADNNWIEVFDGNQSRKLLELEGTLDFPVYASTGHLIYGRRRSNEGLWAVPFSLETLQITGDPFRFFPDINLPNFRPRRSREGQKLYFWCGRSLNEVTLDLSGPEPRMGRPRALFSVAEQSSDTLGPVLVPGRYDVAPDGRFLIGRDRLTRGPGRQEIILVESWYEEFRAAKP